MADRVLVAVDAELLEQLTELLGRALETIERQEHRLDGESKPAGLSIPEAAGEIGVSVTTVGRMIARGDIAPVRIGGRVVIPRQEVERVLAARPVRSVK